MREASLEDARGIFKLFNEKVIRRSSFDSRKISWGHHLEWMKRSLRDKTAIIFVITAPEGFFGQIRFNVDNAKKDEAAVSFSITKDIRGLNLPSFFLTEAIKEFQRSRRGIQKLKAYIRDKNVVSIRSFRRAGFNFERNVKIKRYKAKVYAKRVNVKA